MATIQLILNAINKSSATLKDIAADATILANRIDDANGKLDQMSGSLDAVSMVADRASDRLDHLALSATAAAAGQEAAAHAADQLAVSMVAAATAQTAAAAAANAGGNAARRAWGWWGLLFGQVKLFGGPAALGVLGAIGGLHLIVDVLAEVLAVIVPATLALGAFGLAASDAVENAVRHFENLHTVADQLGRSIYPLTGNLEKLHAAVAPGVYEILGDAFDVLRAKTGEFNVLALGTTKVLDQLAARAALALKAGGVDQFMQHAVEDVAKLGDFFGNLFGTIGNFLKSMPGVAEVLLNILDGISREMEAVSASSIVQNILRVGLAFHGVFIYAGLAATGLLLLRGPLIALAGWAVSGITSLTGLGIAFAAVAAEEGVLAATTALLSAVSPWVWAAVAVGFLVGLVFWLSRSKTATQEWTAALQANIASQQTWTGLMKSLGFAQQQVFTELDKTTSQLAKTTQTYNDVNLHTGVGVSSLTDAYKQQLEKAHELQAAQQQFSDEQALATSRVNALGKQVGGTQVALGLMAQAHIKAGDAATANAGAWKNDAQQVIALQEGLRAMADYAAGNATTSLQVLDQQATDQYKAIQQVNSAWDAFTQNMTGTQSSFDTVAQGLTTLSTYSASFKLHLGVLTTSISGTKTAIDSLAPAGVALNQAFTEEVSNVSKLYDSWRTAGIAQSLFTVGVKASIAPLLTYARGSQEATDQLVGLAEQAGYQGPASMKALEKWIGNTSGATQTLKNVTNQATQQEALLTGAMNAQGNLIARQLLGDINQAILKYDGVTKAAQAYGRAIAQDGAQSDAAKSARQTLINDLIKSGQAAHDSAGQIAAMITKVTGIPAKKALQLVMTGEGKFSIQQLSAIAAGNIGKTSGFASGGYVSAGTHATADDVLARVSKGEYVVKAAAVAKYGTHMFDALNAKRYAAGGLVDAGDLSVLSGQFAVNSANRFQSAIGTALSAAMTRALKQAFSGGVPGSVQSYSGTALSVLSMLHQPLTDLSVVLKQMTTESGGNPFAVNRTDSNFLAGTPSVGLMQVIGPTFRAYAGPFAGVGPFAYGVSENPLANIYAGINYATHRYGPNWTSVLGHGHGYDSGGVIGEPVFGMGLHTGSPYGFAMNGQPETVVPGGGRGAPLIHIGEMHVHDEADIALVSQKLSGMIRMASLGGGARL